MIRDVSLHAPKMDENPFVSGAMGSPTVNEACRWVGGSHIQDQTYLIRYEGHEDRTDAYYYGLSLFEFAVKAQ